METTTHIVDYYSSSQPSSTLPISDGSAESSGRSNSNGAPITKKRPQRVFVLTIFGALFLSILTILLQQQILAATQWTTRTMTMTMNDIAASSSSFATTNSLLPPSSSISVPNVNSLDSSLSSSMNGLDSTSASVTIPTRNSPLPASSTLFSSTSTTVATSSSTTSTIPDTASSSSSSTTRPPPPPQSDQSSTSICAPFFPNSVKTHLFYPKHFFEEGAGKPFLEFTHARPIGDPHYIIYHKEDNNTNNNNDNNNKKKNKNNNDNNNDHNDYNIENANQLVSDTTNNDNVNSICHGTTVYFHLHKCGGSTMKRTRFKYYPGREKYFSQASKDAGSDYKNETSKRWNKVYESQQPHYASSSSIPENKNNYITMFTFIRDPAIRFVSSLGQVLRPNNMNGLGNCPHSTNTTDELVDCVLTKMETKRKFLDLHFIPQSYELYHGMLGYDIGITLIDLTNHFSYVIEHVLGGPDAESMVRAQSNTGTLALGKYLLNEDIAYKFRDRICKLYQADVLMLQDSGLTPTICPFVKEGNDATEDGADMIEADVKMKS